MNKNNYALIYASILYIVFVYVYISIIEWSLHKYIMHGLGLGGSLSKMMGMTANNSHIQHHKETYLDQTLPAEHVVEGLIFNWLHMEIIATLLLFLGGTVILWKYTIVNKIPLYIIITTTILVNVLYLWTWSSIHSTYHQQYIVANDPNNMILSPLPFFQPNTSNPIYKYLFWYHTLHHLNKGESKGNFNIILPLADFIFGTYTPIVDNKLHFLKNTPQNKQEEWLSNHKVFEIRILNDNIIEYKDIGTDKWNTFPNNV